MGRRGAGWFVVLFCATACPLAGFTVADQPKVEVAVLSRRCTGPVARTSTGAWVCAVGSRIGVSRAEDDYAEVPGQNAAVAGATIWTWGDERENQLRRFEDLGAGALLQSPDAGYAWNVGGPIPHRIRTVVARERDLVIAFHNPLEVISVTPNGLGLTSSADHEFTNSSIAGGNTASAFADLGETLWAFGDRFASQGSQRVVCPFSFTSAAGIATGGACSPALNNLVGTASGGLWMSDDGRVAERRVLFHRPTSGGGLAVVESLELPRLPWLEGEVPFVTYPDGSTLLVPRVVGDELTIDRYQATDGAAWAGATTEWIWANPPSGGTRVYRR